MRAAVPSLPAVLVLLPPSEGKAVPPDGAPPVDLDALAHAKALGPVRRKVLRAVPRGTALRRAPAAPARDVYTGVLFARLGLADLPGEDVRIVSGLWGLVAPEDRIPHYKLPIGTSLPRLGAGLAATWRPALAKALAERDVPEEVVVDLRSGPYVAAWKPEHAQWVAVRSFRVAADGTRTVVSHNAKVARGDVARAVLSGGAPVASPADVADAARDAGLEVELGDGVLDVLERA